MTYKPKVCEAFKFKKKRLVALKKKLATFWSQFLWLFWWINSYQLPNGDVNTKFHHHGPHTNQTITPGPFTDAWHYFSARYFFRCRGAGVSPEFLGKKWKPRIGNLQLVSISSRFWLVPYCMWHVLDILMLILGKAEVVCREEAIFEYRASLDSCEMVSRTSGVSLVVLWCSIHFCQPPV